MWWSWPESGCDIEEEEEVNTRNSFDQFDHVNKQCGGLFYIPFLAYITREIRNHPTTHDSWTHAHDFLTTYVKRSKQV
jgi:hypothetical protein